jgi:hypothetical protein
VVGFPHFAKSILGKKKSVKKYLFFEKKFGIKIKNKKSPKFTPTTAYKMREGFRFVHF